MSNVITERDGGILRIQFDRVEKKNAITAAMYSALADTIVGAATDPAVRVLLVHGTEDVFTAGNDLQDFLQNPPTGTESPVLRFLQAIATAPKPIVAAVGGVAVGVGTTMLLHCDLVYAAENARFHLPFVDLGLCPEAASSLLLPAMAGYHRAAELLLLADPFGPDVAREAGIVTAVVSREALMETALGAARRLAEKPAAAVRLTKALMKAPLARDVQTAMTDEGRHFLERLRSPEAREAFSAFLEKRKPDFSQFE